MEKFNHKNPEHWLRLPLEIGSCVLSELLRPIGEAKYLYTQAQAVRRMVAETVYEQEDMKPL
jgi:hypothetical protein